MVDLMALSVKYFEAENPSRFNICILFYLSAVIWKAHSVFQLIKIIASTFEFSSFCSSKLLFASFSWWIKQAAALWS